MVIEAKKNQFIKKIIFSKEKIFFIFWKQHMTRNKHLG